MPGWIIDLLVKLAVSLGLPWLMKKFPGLPAEIWAILEDILNHIHGAPDKEAAVKQIREKVSECTGISCPSDTKKLD